MARAKTETTEDEDLGRATLEERLAASGSGRLKWSGCTVWNQWSFFAAVSGSVAYLAAVDRSRYVRGASKSNIVP